MQFFLLFATLSQLAAVDAGLFSFSGTDRDTHTTRKLRGEPVFSVEFGIECNRRCENPGESCIPNPARLNMQTGVYQCTCSEGHVYTANGDACKFEEQCARATSPCGKNAECVQNEGGFACVCPTEWTGGAYTECIPPERLQTPAPVAPTPAPGPGAASSTPAPQPGFVNRTRALKLQQIKQKIDIHADIPFHIRHNGELPSNTVYMTGPDEPTEAILAIKLQNDVQVEFFNNRAMTKSVEDISFMLEEEGIEGAYEAYLTLRPWAFRSDLWRLMILWANGGIYVDADILVREPFMYWAALNQDEEIATCVDVEGNSTSFDSTEITANFFQAMLSGKKGSPLLLKAIDFIVDNIKNRRYGIEGFKSTDLSITGPHALGHALRDNYDQVRTSCRLHQPVGCEITECTEVRGYVPTSVSTPWTGGVARRILADIKHEIREEMLGNNATEQSPYARAFKNKSVYCDEDGPSCKLW